MSKFVVVKFVEENDVIAIVSSNWLNDSRNASFFPNGPSVNAHLKKHAIPAPDWAEYPVEIMAEDENYAHARRHLIKAQYESNLESDADEPNEKNRRLPRTAYEEAQVEPTTRQETKSKKSSKISKYPTLESFSVSSETNSSSADFSNKLLPSPTLVSSGSTSISSTPPLSHPSNFSNTPTSLLTAANCSSFSTVPSSSFALPLPEISASPTVSSDPQFHPSISSPSDPFLHTSASCPANILTQKISEMENKMALVIGQLQSTIADLVSVVKEQKQQLSSFLQQNPIQRSADESREIEENILIGKLPLSTIEDFKIMEESLKDAKIFKLLLKVLITLGGRDLKNYIYNILRRVLTSQLAMKFSFTGKQPKEKEKKIAFSSTILYKSIQVNFQSRDNYETRFHMEVPKISLGAAIKKVYGDAKEDMIKTHVSHWLQQAKHRTERKETSNKEISIQEED